MLIPGKQLIKNTENLHVKKNAMKIMQSFRKSQL